MRKNWRIVDRGVNGEPFLWRRDAGRQFVMIDIFNPDPSNHCYPVLLFRGNPYAAKDPKGKLIGIGCADVPEENWNNAYQNARKIAEQYMIENKEA